MLDPAYHVAYFAGFDLFDQRVGEQPDGMNRLPQIMTGRRQEAAFVGVDGRQCLIEIGQAPPLFLRAALFR